MNEIAIKTFTTADAFQSFSANFLNNEICTRWLINRLHPDGAVCPHCQTKIIDETTLDNFANMSRCKCKSCNKWFSATVGTILHNAHLEPAEVYLLAVLLELKIDIKTIAKILGVHPGSIKNWKMKFEVCG
ncbi:MAG: hypothetical protein AABX86_01260 [Nanoarchaeota archaeon]